MIKETHIIRGTIYSLEELAEIADGVRVREKENKEMTKTMEKMVGRIYEELSKWCAERNVIYEYNFSTDEGESCTFITTDTTLTVNHVEARDPEQFSKYVKSVLFGVDDIIIDRLKPQVDDLKKEIVVKDAYIGRLEKEDIEKAKDIEYLEKELKKLRDEKDNCKYWLNVRATKISELSNIIEEKEKNLNVAADKIIQLKCANTSLNEQIDILRCSLNKEREGYGELKDQYDDKCKAFIDMCTHYDSEVAKRKKAEYELKELKAGRHDDTVDVTRYLVVLGKKKRAEEKIRSLKSQVEICKDVVKNLADQNEAFKKQVDALTNEKLKILAEDDATMDILKKKNATLQYKVDTLENDVKSLTFSYKKELEKKEKENLELDNNVKDMWATLRSLRKDNVELRDANDFLHTKLESHNEIINKLNKGSMKKDDEITENDVLTRIADRVNKLEDDTLFINDMLTGISVRLDKIERPISIGIDLSLSEVMKDLDERIAWITDHMENAENDVARSIEKIGEELRRVDNELIHAFTRINKLEDAQPKESAKKTSKKSQKSTLS